MLGILGWQAWRILGWQAWRHQIRDVTTLHLSAQNCQNVLWWTMGADKNRS